MVFASAAHGWAFDLRVFAERWAKKLGMRAEMLRRTLWGEFYFQPKGPKVVRSSANGRLKPMFVQFVLTSVWQAYGALLTEPDAALRDKIVKSLGLSVPERELRHADALVQLRAVFGAWLPLSANVLRAVAEQLPRAAAAQTARLPRLCPTLADADLSTAVAELSVAADAAAGASLGALRAGVERCDAAAPALAYVAKMVYVGGAAGAHADDVFIAFARVFSGALRPGSGGVLHVRLHGGGGASGGEERTLAVDGLRLYRLMGRELVRVEEAEAGCVCGIGGIGGASLKGATLSAAAACPPFEPMAFEGAPLVQVAVEPLDPTALPALLRALELLDQADPAVEVAQLDTGEHVLRTCGEVHLERCLVDLRTTFAPDVRLSVSPPIVPFREGVAAATAAAAVEPTVASTANRRCTVSVRAVALPEAVASELSRHRDALRLALQSGRSWLAADRLEAATRARSAPSPPRSATPATAGRRCGRSAPRPPPPATTCSSRRRRRRRRSTPTAAAPSSRRCAPALRSRRRAARSATSR